MRSTYVMTRFTVPLENLKNISVFEVFHEMDPDPALQKPRVRNSGNSEVHLEGPVSPFL